MTVTQARSFLVARLRGALSLAGLSTVTDAAVANLDLDGPIGFAAEAVGAPVADLAAPTDAELAAVPAARRREFIERALLDVLEAIRGNWTDVTYSLDGRSESLSDLLNALNQAIAAQQTLVKAQYGVGLAPPTVGRLLGGRRPRRGGRSW